MKKAIIVQARMTSTRLPGKILKTVLNKPLLEYLIERLRRVKYADQIIIATTVNDTDEPIVALCKKLHVDVYRGPENDVLTRYYGAARQFGVDLIARVTSDCPLIDPAVIDRVFQVYLEEACEYVSNCEQRTYPRGMDVEVFPFSVLKKAYHEAHSPFEREHVTPYICEHPGLRKLDVVYIRDGSKHRWTVDTPEDFELIKRIIEALYPQKPEYNLEDCLRLLEENAEWSSLNEHVKQKEA